MTGWVVACVLGLLAIAGAPLFAVIAAAGLLAFSAAGIDMAAMIAELYRLVDFPALIAIPLFTFAGYLLAESDAPRRILGLADALLGWVPGGLAVVAIASTAVFTAFSGASGVTIIALGGLIFPALVKQGYPEKFSLGLMTTSGSLGLLFPPSLPVVLYGIVAGVSLDQLFRAGLLPGLVLIAVLSAYSIHHGVRARVARTRFTMRGAGNALREAAWEMPLLPLVLVGIYGGFITASEAAAMTALYVLVVEVLIRREVSIRKGLPKSIKESMLLVGAILMMLGASMGMTSWIIDQQVPERLFGFVSTIVTSKLAFLLLLNAFLLVMNMLEIFSAIVIVVPIIVPIAMSYGVDPVHLGIIFLLNLEIGYMTPPLGLNLFLSSIRFGRPLPEVYRTVLPFFGLLLLVLLAVTYIPALSLALAGN